MQRNRAQLNNGSNLSAVSAGYLKSKTKLISDDNGPRAYVLPKCDTVRSAGASLHEAPELQQLALNFLATFLVVVTFVLNFLATFFL